MNAVTANRIAIDAQAAKQTQEGVIARLNERIEATAKNALFELKTETMSSEKATRLKEHFKDHGFFVQKFRVNDPDAPYAKAYLVIGWGI